MFWADKLIETLNPDQEHIINDSKTPSGRAHVGALRGVLIHDVMFRLMQAKGFKVRYTFGVDDYDPLDEIPYGKDEHYQQYLGRPLCEVPPPPGSDATDMADYYISDFFRVFDYLGVEVEKYRLRDIYRAGEFDAAIETILQHAPIVRQVYKQISGSQRPDNWYPFQVVCEQCKRIGTTEVTDFDGKEVTYHCKPNLVKWATGCGYHGKVSPYSGNGKLPWKLEWVAKWATRGITVEGAGKDHTTKGGSRDVSSNCLKRIFNKAAPLNIPYEFFLVEGAKMSSSRGIGVAASDMAEFLPAEILRFLMLRPQPNRPINFSPDEQAIVKLFNEFDRFRAQAFQDTTPQDIKQVYQLSEVQPEAHYYTPDIQLLQVLVQMPHINVIEEISKRHASTLSALELKHLERRIASINYWLTHYATEEERFQLQATLPASAQTLNATQAAFLQTLAQKLPRTVWRGDKLQTAIFDVARLTPIKQQAAFQAIYQTLFARELGPRAGNLFEYLEPKFLITRFNEVSYVPETFWHDTGVNPTDGTTWLSEQQAAINQTWIRSAYSGTTGILEIYASLQPDGKVHVQRILFNEVSEESFMQHAQEYLDNLTARFNLPLTLSTDPLQTIF